MGSVLLVFIGGGLGSVARHLVNVAAGRLFGASFPWGTLTVNVLGSLAMGLLAGWLGFRSGTGGQHLRLFLAVGMLGGFTTFSSFSLDAIVLWERGETIAAASYVIASVAVALAALMAGLAIARQLG
ncbi:fluoride efflux transporter CrcB [Terrihabitans sp. B22-R8]|uniref:fluoride efflux transporter CrcB n=1 Tax=Terrihabitans sp. B22-R8 TaxID=3425128 RepID=UPI00403CEB54